MACIIIAGDRHKLVQEAAVEEAALGAEEVVEVEAVVVVEEEVALGAEVDLLEVVVVVALGAEEGFRTHCSSTSDFLPLFFFSKAPLCSHQKLNSDLNMNCCFLLHYFLLHVYVFIVLLAGGDALRVIIIFGRKPQWSFVDCR